MSPERSVSTRRRGDAWRRRLSSFLSSFPPLSPHLLNLSGTSEPDPSGDRSKSRAGPLEESRIRSGAGGVDLTSTVLGHCEGGERRRRFPGPPDPTPAATRDTEPRGRPYPTPARPRPAVRCDRTSTVLSCRVFERGRLLTLRAQVESPSPPRWGLGLWK